ncbi:MAG TPA: hypothetical protein VKV28_13860 [Candidatus Binataceae bacterium]|nr:hypothetical protein [Candidatus Binataceae bacterium]
MKAVIALLLALALPGIAVSSPALARDSSLHPAFLWWHKKKPKPPLMIPRLPLQAAPGIRVMASLPLGPDFKLLGAGPPVWITPQELALVGQLGQRTVIAAFSGENFQQTGIVVAGPKPADGKLLDVALSADHQRFATVASLGDSLAIGLSAAQRVGPGVVVSEIPGRFTAASIAWLGPNLLAIGAIERAAASSSASATASPTPSPSGTATAPVRDSPLPATANATPSSALQPSPTATPIALVPHLFVVSLAMASEPIEPQLDCLGQIDPTRLYWSRNGRLAVAAGAPPTAGRWFLIDRLQASCSPIMVRGGMPVGFLQWGQNDGRFLFTAIPNDGSGLSAIAVMEYTVADRVAQTVVQPAAAATYTIGTNLAAIASRNVTPALLRTEPDRLIPAELDWFTWSHAQVQIVPLGVQVRAGALLEAEVGYCASRGLLSAELTAPGPGGDFPALMWIANSLRAGGVLAFGQTHGFLSASFSPGCNRIALLGGQLDRPTGAVIAMPTLP